MTSTGAYVVYTLVALVLVGVIILVFLYKSRRPSKQVGDQYLAFDNPAVELPELPPRGENRHNIYEDGAESYLEVGPANNISESESNRYPQVQVGPANTESSTYC